MTTTIEPDMFKEIMKNVGIQPKHLIKPLPLTYITPVASVMAKYPRPDLRSQVIPPPALGTAAWAPPLSYPGVTQMQKNALQYPDLAKRMGTEALQQTSEQGIAKAIGDNRFVDVGRAVAEAPTKQQKEVLNQAANTQENILAQVLSPQEDLLKQILLALQGQNVTHTKAVDLEHKYDNVQDEIDKIEDEMRLSSLIKEAPKPPGVPPEYAEPESYDFSMIDRYSHVELKAFCKLFGLQVSGKKADLKQRLGERQDKLLKDYVDLGIEEDMARELTKTPLKKMQGPSEVVVEGKGLVRAPKGSEYIPFGAYRLHARNLQKGVLSLAHKDPRTLRKVVGFANRSVTPEYHEALASMIGTGIFPDTGDLGDDEKEHLYRLVAKSNVDVRMNPKQSHKVDSYRALSEKTGKHKDLERLKRRFDICTGEVRAGNNNLQNKREIRTILASFLRQNVIDLTEYRDLLSTYCSSSIP